MRPFESVLRLGAALALLATPTFPALAQSNSGNAPAGGNAASASAGGALKILNLADYGRWNRVTSTGLSPDGKWMSYAYQPNDGDATLFIRGLDTDKLYTIPVGSAPVFSDDSRWVGYFVSPPTRAAGAAGTAGTSGGAGAGAPGSGGRGGAAAGGGRGGRGGGAGGGAGGGTAQPATPTTGAPAANPRRFELLSLVTGEKTPIANASTVKFAKGSKFLAIRMNRPAGAAGATSGAAGAAGAASVTGADLIVRDLSNGSMRNIGNVNLYEFDNAGKLLAYTVDAAERIVNGVYLLNPVSGETRVAGILAEKDLILFQCTGKDRFWLSDNPVVMMNSFPYGRIGLKAPGIEVYMPVSQHRCLAFLCPSICEIISECLDPADPRPTLKNPFYAPFPGAVPTGNPVPTEARFVDALNGIWT